MVFIGSTAHSVTVTKESQAALHYCVRKRETLRHCSDFRIRCMTRIRNPQDYEDPLCQMPLSLAHEYLIVLVHVLQPHIRTGTL